MMCMFLKTSELLIDFISVCLSCLASCLPLGLRRIKGFCEKRTSIEKSRYGPDEDC